MLLTKQNFKMAFLAVALSSSSLVALADNLSTFGTVDREKVVANYPKAQAAAEDLKVLEDKIRKLVEESNKKFDDAKAAKKPQAEIEGLQRRLQTQLDEEVKKVKKHAEDLESQLENAIDSAIKAEAASRKLDTVFSKGAVLLGGVDLTNNVIKRLSVGSSSAAPASNGTSAAASASDKAKSKAASK